MGALLLGFALGVIIAIAVYLMGNLLRSVQVERRRAGVKKVWKHFGLSLAFCILFLTSWAAHGVAEWQVYTDQQTSHNQPTELGDFAAEFAQSTLENWQSEFLQLFSFVVMSALLIHRGSAESKDGDQRIEEALRRIEARLGTES